VLHVVVNTPTFHYCQNFREPRVANLSC
jgi:hypothetical protein